MRSFTCFSLFDDLKMQFCKRYNISFIDFTHCLFIRKKFKIMQALCSCNVLFCEKMILKALSRNNQYHVMPLFFCSKLAEKWDLKFLCLITCTYQKSLQFFKILSKQIWHSDDHHKFFYEYFLTVYLVSMIIVLLTYFFSFFSR